MIKPVHVLSILTLSCLVGCQTTNSKSKDSCSQLDWFEIGRADGIQGLPSVGWEAQQNQCDGFSDADYEGYQNGWNAALNSYCTESQGFALGSRGFAHSNLCPPGREQEFLKGYALGLKVFEYETERHRLSMEMQEISMKLSFAKGDEESQLWAQLHHLESQMELNQALIQKIQSSRDELSEKSVIKKRL